MMSLNRKIVFLADEFDEDIIKMMVDKLLLSKRLEINCDEKYVYNKNSINNITGRILLVSYGFSKSIEVLNQLKSNFTYVNFIDPVAFSQIDENKLFQQINQINEDNLIELQNQTWTSNWTYSDYYQLYRFFN